MARWWNYVGTRLPTSRLQGSAALDGFCDAHTHLESSAADSLAEWLIESEKRLAQMDTQKSRPLSAHPML